MKKHILGLPLIFSLIVLSPAQEIKAPFDVRKCQEELEIMKGIISTKLSYAAGNSQKGPSPLWRFSDINAFYLSGQGAVFVIPTSSLGPSDLRYSLNDLGKLREQIELFRIQNQQAELQSKAPAEAYSRLGQMTSPPSRTGSGTGSGTGSSATEAPQAATAPPSPAPPAPPAPPYPSQLNREEPAGTGKETLMKLSEFYERSQKREEEEKANREKFLRRLADAKVSLIETLANYGDSLTTVKADDHINLVLLIDAFGTDRDDGLDIRKTSCDIISVQKSWITDYKAGRLSLDNFKQKVLQYSE